MVIKETLRFKGDFDYKLSTKLIFRVLTNAMEIDASVSYEASLSFFYKTKFAQRDLLLSVKDKPVHIEKL